MVKTYRDLTQESIAKLEPLIKYWSLLEGIDLDWPLDHYLDVANTDMGQRYCAEFAITYAVLLDDKELVEDLCTNGASLDVKDDMHGLKTPVEIAIEYGRAGVLNILLQHGGKIPADVVVPTNNFYLTVWSLYEQRVRAREADYTATKDVVSRHLNQ
jgi:hypothetical protein